ncbi:MAG: hypothetical protein DRP69_03880 [Candidatus Duberdicusella sinuisediminis]|nr:MAG: hypothetical protein DRP69_03880 [Candidatus Omnitrophota bacterium]
MPETSTLFTKRKINPYLLFFLLCFFLYLPSVFFRSPLPPDEVRFLSIAKNIHNWKDFFFLKYLGSFYYDKPPLYFWFLKLFSLFNLTNSLFLPVLFNCFFSWGILSLNYFFFKKEGQPQIGLISSLILATTSIFYAMNVIVRMDILFLFFTLLSIYSFLFYLSSEKKFYLWIASLASFLAVFTKGALGIIFPFFLSISLSVILKSKEILKKSFLTYLFSFFLVLFWLISFSQIDKDYFREMFYKQTLLRGIGETGHSRNFFYYFLYLIPLFLPYTILSLTCFSLKLESVWEKLFLIWFIGGVFILSLISSKLSIYLLILSPSLSALLAKSLLESNKERLKKVLFNITGLFFVILWFSAYFYFKFKKEFIPPVSFILLLVFLVVIFLMVRKKSWACFKVLFISWILVIYLSTFFFLPLVDDYFKAEKEVNQEFLR